MGPSCQVHLVLFVQVTVLIRLNRPSWLKLQPSQNVWIVFILMFLKCSISQMEHFSNGAFLKWSISQMEQFSNGAILKWSISQMERFSNGAILKWSDSQMEQFSNGAIWGRHPMPYFKIPRTEKYGMRCATHFHEIHHFLKVKDPWFHEIHHFLKVKDPWLRLINYQTYHIWVFYKMDPVFYEIY